MTPTIVYETENGTRVVAIPEGAQVVVGRLEGCQLQIMHPSVSRRHCTLTNRSGRCTLDDLGSSNGTFVNGERLSEARLLTDGDQVVAGEISLTFREGVPTPRRRPRGPDTSITIVPARALEDSIFLKPGTTRAELSLERAHAGLKVLYRIANILYEAGSMDQIHAGVLEALQAVLPADRALILRYDPRTDEGEVLAARGEGTTDISGLSGTVLSETLSGKGVVLSLDARADARFDRSQSVVLSNIRSVVSAPIEFEERVFGILYLDTSSRLRAFTQEDAELVGSVAHQAGATIYRHLLIQERRQAQMTVVQKLAELAEQRDPETGNHLKRVSSYAVELARQLGRDTGYAHCAGSAFLDELVFSAPLHDIGKVGIPDAILLKPGRLDPGEFELMKTHTTIGAQVLAGPDFLHMAREIALCHHEKWDGSGYPQGLAADAIPLSARIMALADVYDALRSRRIYKEAFSHERSCQIMVESRGTHFDPRVLEAFLARQGAFAGLWDRYREESA